MTSTSGDGPAGKSPKTNAQTERHARLEAELKANIARRKAQARSRKDDAGSAENTMKNGESKASF